MSPAKHVGIQAEGIMSKRNRGAAVWRAVQSTADRIWLTWNNLARAKRRGGLTSGIRPKWGQIEPLERRVLLTNTIYVDYQSSQEGQNGGSWSTAFSDLQTALDNVSANGTVIDIAAGNYTPSDSLDSAASFHLPAGITNITLVGGFFGGTTLSGLQVSGFTSYAVPTANRLEIPARPFIPSFPATVGQMTNNLTTAKNSPTAIMS